MSPEDDARYFRLDFRKKSNKSSSADRQCEQYWEICKAIWPEYESRAAFEQLDLRKFFFSFSYPFSFFCSSADKKTLVRQGKSLARFMWLVSRKSWSWRYAMCRSTSSWTLPLAVSLLPA